MSTHKFTFVKEDPSRNLQDTWYRGDEPIGFINSTGNLQMVRGHGEERDELEAFIAWHEAHDKPTESEAPPIEDYVELAEKEDKTPEEKAELDAMEDPRNGGAPVKEVTGPSVPEVKPGQSGGRGKFDPPYFWWAWNQSEAVFRGIYGKSQAEFKASENGGYVDKVKQVLSTNQ